MLTTSLNELSKYRAKIAELEKKVSAERVARLRSLHDELGFASRDDLIAALRGIGKGGGGRKAGGGKRRRRAKITPEMRKSIEAASREGKLTGAQIAEQFGISLPSVQNIKRDAGLTKKRRKK